CSTAASRGISRKCPMTRARRSAGRSTSDAGRLVHSRAPVLGVRAMDIASLFSLEGRVALVTGGSRGIGLMIVEGFIAAGCARVYICARKPAELEEARAALGDGAVTLEADLSTLGGIEALAGEIAAREDRLDILVNNAGAAWGAPFGDFPEGGWDKVMDLNLKAPFFLTQKLHPL